MTDSSTAGSAACSGASIRCRRPRPRCFPGRQRHERPHVAGRRSDLPGTIRGLGLAVYGLRHRPGGEHWCLYHRPRGHFLWRTGRDRPLRPLEPVGYRRRHPFRRLGVLLLRVLVGGQRQDLRHGGARHPRRRGGRLGPGATARRRPGAGVPAQLPAVRTGFPGNPRAARAPRPARPHRRLRGHLCLGCAGGPAPVPRPPGRTPRERQRAARPRRGAARLTLV